MSASATPLQRGLARSGGLVAAGLAIEATTFFWGHPTSFLLFAFVGVALVAAGIVLYLWTIARG